MKRYRLLGVDFDSRALDLTTEIKDEWEERVKHHHRENRRQTEEVLIFEYGEQFAERKRQNFADLGPKPFSVLTFHNQFLHEIRRAFTIGGYYPALTGACALGERILNHMLLTLRDHYKATPEYKGVYRKDSFDNWDVPIDALEAWGVLLPQAAAEFRHLRDHRNNAIHFRPEVDSNARELSLAAIKSLEEIITHQFAAFGPQPWFITCVPGEMYIKREWEEAPFVKHVYLPNCVSLGPRHQVVAIMPWQIKDDAKYEDVAITDEEFCTLRKAAIAGFFEK